MTVFTMLLSRLIGTIIRIEMLFLLVRAILSWVMPDRGSRVWQIVYGMTEPVLLPMRGLLSRFRFCQTCPIDLSFLATVLLLEAVLTLLPG